MSKEIPLKLIISTMSHEKGVSEEIIFQAIEAALISATKKKYGQEQEFMITIDRQSGIYETNRYWIIVPDEKEEDDEEPFNPEAEILYRDAQKTHPDLEIGDKIEEPIVSVEFGRISAQAAKQVIINKVREAERALVAEEFKSKVGQLISGVVKKTTRDTVIVDLGGNAEGVLRKEAMLPRESFRIGDRVRAYLKEISTQTRSPQLILSRVDTNMLVELFKVEVPEVGEGIIEIKGAARDPGQRAKIAVHTNDGRIDPVGACVGMRGARVQAVSNELGGERVDIILWDPEPVQFVINAMAPAEIVSIEVDEEHYTMVVAIKDEFLSQAIGRNGQNVRLANGLTGWTLSVIGAEEAQEKSSSEFNTFKKLFEEKLNVEAEVSELLVSEGFTSLEEIAFVPQHELMAIDGFDEEIVESLRTRAKEILSQEEEEKQTLMANLEPELLAMVGVTDEIAGQLATHKIHTRDDLAECSVEELVDIIAVSTEQAGELIMAARAHWFAEEK